MSKIIICHHDDTDGRLAASILHYHLTNSADLSEEIELYEMDYGMPFPNATEDDTVYVLDISVSETDVEKFINLYKTCKDLVWIDHHQTSLNTLSKTEYSFLNDVQGIRAVGYCGTYLTALYIEGYDGPTTLTKEEVREYYDAEYVIIKMDSPYDELIFQTDIFDCWKNPDAIDPYALNNYVMSLGTPTKENIDSFPNQSISREELDHIYDIGGYINKYNTVIYKELEKNNMFEVEFEGSTIAVINSPIGNSKVFGESFYEYDAVCMVKLKGKDKWGYSLYSKEDSNFDCGAIAEKYGGGGHKHASGFSSDKFIF